MTAAAVQLSSWLTPSAARIDWVTAVFLQKPSSDMHVFHFTSCSSKHLTFPPTLNAADKLTYTIFNTNPHVQTLQTCNITGLHTCTLATQCITCIYTLSTNDHLSRQCNHNVYACVIYSNSAVLFRLLTSRKHQFGAAVFQCLHPASQNTSARVYYYRTHQ